MKKIVAFLLVAVMAVLAVVSCAPLTPEEVIANADKALEGEKYKVSANISVDCDHPEYGEIFSQIFTSSLGGVEYYFDGGNFLTEISMELMGFKMDMSVSAVGNTVYVSMADNKMKATATSEQINDLIANMNSENGVASVEDFAELSMVEENGKTYITCTVYDAEKINELVDEAKTMFGMLDDDIGISVSDVKLVATINDGKYEDLTMFVGYSFNADGEAVTVDMSMGMVFDYAAGKEISAPADAESYEEVDFSDLGLG